MGLRGIAGRDISASLDNWITGHYGEDQFRGLSKCRVCGELLCDSFDRDEYDGVCFLCRERECVVCGKTWKAEDDDGGVDYYGEENIPGECPACREEEGGDGGDEA